MLTPINLRFAQLIKEIGLNKNAFAQSLGKTASVVQHLIDGRNKPGYDLLCKVFEIYPNVSKDWLMEGQGPMLLSGGLKATSAAGASVVALKRGPAATPLFAASTTKEMVEVPAASYPKPAYAPVASVAPAMTVLPAAPPTDVVVGAALQTQHLLHQLALAELRNQHLLEQQQMLRQMVEMAQGR